MTAAESRMPRILEAFGDPTRYRIVSLLLARPGICVSDLAEQLGLSVSAVSQQCKLLELSGVLVRQRHGQRTCYRLNHQDRLIQKTAQFIFEQGGDDG